MANKKPVLPPNNTGKKYERRALDPRVAVFKAHYTNPNSDTFMNVLQSALRAGYSQEYSESLGYQNPKWFEDMLQDTDVRRARMLLASEKALERAIHYDDSDNHRANLKIKAATFITERLGRDAYSTRQEITGADGRAIFANDDRERAKAPLSTLFKGVKAVE